MKILKSNAGKEIVPVLSSHIFVSITDYGLKSILKEVIVSPGQHHWMWIVLGSTSIDIKDIGDRFSSFDNALNRVVNDLYSTVYEFSSFDEMVKNWSKIKHVDKIETVYTLKG